MQKREMIPRWGENQRLTLITLLASCFLSICPATIRGATGATADLAKCAVGQPAREAIEGCTKNLKLPDTGVSKRSDFLLIRGGAYYSLQEFALASADLRNALAIKYSPDVAFLLAASEYNLGNNAEAINLLSKMISSGQATIQVFALRGMAFQNAGDFDASIADFDKELALDPNSLVALNNRAAAHTKKGDYEAAIKDIDSILAINPKMTAALMNRCQLFARQGEFDKGRSSCDEAERLEPNNYFMLLNIGAAYYLEHRYENAIAYYNRSLGLMPGYAPALYSRGVAEAKIGKEQESKADISAAIRAMPNIGAIMSSAGMK